MTTLLYANFAKSTLAFPILPNDTTAVLAAGTGAFFPQPSSGEGFYLTFQDAATGVNTEIVLVTGINGDNITSMVRGQQGTSQQQWAVGDIAAQYNTAGDMQHFIQSVGTSYVTGVTATAPVLSSGGAIPNISLHYADSTHDGYLTKEDWSLFNSKGNGSIVTVAATYPVLSSGGNNPNISLHVADATHDGYLSASDWVRFNSGVNEGINTISIQTANGFSGSATSGNSSTITLNTTITGLLKGNGSAITAATSGTDYAPATPSTVGILSGNGSGGFSNITLGSGLNFASGTLSNSGLLSLTVSGTQNGLTLSRTITNGVADVSLTGTLANVSLTTQVIGVLPIANGGTNSTDSPTAGGIVYGNGSKYSITGAGSSGQFLTSNGAGAPTWTTFSMGTAVTAIYVTSPLQTTGTTTPLLSILQANGTQGGYLSSADWQTFNTTSTNAAQTITVETINGFAGSASGTTSKQISLRTTVGTSVAPVLLKGNGTSISAAVSGTDYAPATTGSSILAGNGSGGFTSLTLGSGLSLSSGVLKTNTSGQALLSGDNNGGFSNVTIGTGLSFVGGTLSATGGGGGGGTGNVSTSGLPQVNYICRFTSANTISNSIIYDDGTNVSIGLGGAGSYKLDVGGVINSNSTIQTTGGRFYASGSGLGTTFGRANLAEIAQQNQNQYGLVLRNITATTDYGFAAAIDDTGSVNFYNRTGGFNNLWLSYNSDNTSRFYSNGLERLRFSSGGGFGLSGANYGSTGQVLTSQGADSPPVWNSPTAGSTSLITRPLVGMIAHSYGNNTVNQAHIINHKIVDTTGTIQFNLWSGIGVSNPYDMIRVWGMGTINTVNYDGFFKVLSPITGFISANNTGTTQSLTYFQDAGSYVKQGMMIFGNGITPVFVDGVYQNPPTFVNSVSGSGATIVASQSITGTTSGNNSYLIFTLPPETGVIATSNIGTTQSLVALGSGIAAGMKIAGEGVPADCYIVSISGNSFTASASITAVAGKTFYFCSNYFPHYQTSTSSMGFTNYNCISLYNHSAVGKSVTSGSLVSPMGKAYAGCAGTSGVGSGMIPQGGVNWANMYLGHAYEFLPNYCYNVSGGKIVPTFPQDAGFVGNCTNLVTQKASTLPKYVFIDHGVNDANGAANFTTVQNAVIQGLAILRNAGIVPIWLVPRPFYNSTSSQDSGIWCQSFTAWLKSYMQKVGGICMDTNLLLVDPSSTTNYWITGTNADNVHLSCNGAIRDGRIIAQQLAPIFRPCSGFNPSNTDRYNSLTKLGNMLPNGNSSMPYFQGGQFPQTVSAITIPKTTTVTQVGTVYMQAYSGTNTGDRTITAEIAARTDTTPDGTAIAGNELKITFSTTATGGRNNVLIQFTSNSAGSFYLTDNGGSGGTPLLNVGDQYQIDLEIYIPPSSLEANVVYNTPFVWTEQNVAWKPSSWQKIKYGTFSNGTVLFNKNAQTGAAANIGTDLRMSGVGESGTYKPSAVISTPPMTWAGNYDGTGTNIYIVASAWFEIASGINSTNPFVVYVRGISLRKIDSNSAYPFN